MIRSNNNLFIKGLPINLSKNKINIIELETKKKMAEFDGVDLKKKWHSLIKLFIFGFGIITIFPKYPTIIGHV